jgi:hypothetical protein
MKSTRERNLMTEQEMRKAAEALIYWRKTERDMIADKTAFNMQAHALAKRHVRDLADGFIKRGVQP